MTKVVNHERTSPVTDTGRCLDTVQLEGLERSFRSWAEASKRPDTKLSRRRILLIFLLIRYTGARLNEVLNLDPLTEIDFKSHIVHLKKGTDETDRAYRVVEVSEALSSEIKRLLDVQQLKQTPGGVFRIDPGHVRRKFYERAEACGIPRELGAPDAIRRSRAVELIQGNMPLPVVQKILGHSTPNLAASYLEFSDEEIHNAVRFFVDRENQRKTSARNAFFGKINQIQKGDIQAIVEIVALGGHRISAVITNHSLARLGLKRGTLVMAEVKAPWVMIYKGDEEPRTTAENIFCGSVHRISNGKITTEVVVRISDSMELCSVITEKGRKMLDIHENDTVWIAFNASTVVLHVD
ncbi:conserved hypothetical protein [uncultured Desulfobacterium sp.]|uniref:Transporter n=1 Tax=uncultured Desulfobacterium sp. TaxID=201089 RepID=A0A445N3N5_9BACT|nr:conserved hypothetical protein [uncultured Desulfobacterium sp.]